MEQRTVTISLTASLSQEVDRVARAEGRGRSELVREALRQYLARKERWGQIFAYGRESVARVDVSEREVLPAVKERRRARAR
jgi:metal-responsive CopG/Arc/MetJ family transcriptional regulator